MTCEDNLSRHLGGGPELNDWIGRYEDEERYLHETLTAIQEQYAKAAKPYIDRLAQIHAMRTPEPVIMTIEQAQALGLTPLTQHNLEFCRIAKIYVCKKCGAASHDDGYWWLANRRSKIAPPCSTSSSEFYLWRSKAEDGTNMPC